MQPSLEKLRKFFRLEHENKYENTAIIGGLAKMLDYWEGEARADGVAEEVIQAVAARLRSYEKLSPEGRAESLKGLWKRIGETYPEAGQKPKTQQQPNRVNQPPRPPRPEQATPPPPEEESAPIPQEQKSQPRPQEQRKPQQQQRPAPPSPRPRSEVVPGARTSQTPAAFNADITVIQGVGPKHAESLKSLGMQTLGDMLYYFPRRYEDYSQLKPIKSLFYGEVVTVLGTVQSVHTRPIRGGKSSIVEVVINDGTGGLRLSFFNQPWVANRFKEGEAISVSGKVDQYLGRLVMNTPDWEPIEVENLHTARIVPIYALTEKVTQKWLRKIMNEVVSYWAPSVVDALPEKIKLSARLVSLSEALTQVHFPLSQSRLKAARERLGFDEIFYLQMGVLRQKRDWKDAEARRFPASTEWLDTRLSSLPFALTSAQQKALEDIRADLDSGKPMNRLVQGDVGSGKTVVAALGASIVTQDGAQAAIMAPTSILAEQHYRNFTSLLAGENGPLQKGEICLLVGSTPEAEKETIRQGLADGSIKIVIGTHAVIEPDVLFKDLEYIVIDEQHRFGVEQRKELRSKGTNPHLLVMTATPIPRSLALTVFGDLDLSVIDELPVGRQPIDTYVLRPQERERAFTMIRGQIRDGRQAFIVYPLIDESEKIEARAAVDDFEVLSNEVFPDLKLGLLHGRMKPSEKDEVMMKFRDKEYDILVSTTVVEVGVDVPNSTVMLIEGADRFGLSQLHQLRGRVGRGAAQSYCLLIPTREDATENERLQAMAKTNSGFELADLDLKTRGPGEFLGTRQAGFANALKMASITDVTLIEKARTQAQALFERDPYLQLPEHALLSEAFERFWGAGKGDVS
ncbi:ATP-dependent DNA helicase RecG [Candidatus Villigracilis affinis]|uniref:ATP-dependent DNA helicase RecG n=1 Tax=Candidatus Villigracilis affinis TaxID=3140682 RepID=UPI002A1AD54F|nr:ATP-dependent DNA helicase RecG [Anaerolineales bacterium]